MSIHERIELLQTAHGHLEEFVGYLVKIRELLQPFQDALDTDDLVEALSQMGVTLTIEGENISWTPDHIAQAHLAVMNIIKRIASESGSDDLFALILFKEVSGGTTIQLTEGDFGDASYASTSTDGRTIFLYTYPIEDPERDLYWKETDYQRCAEFLGLTRQQVDAAICHERGYIPLYTAENITHEFGHVLVNRYEGSRGDIALEWNVLLNLINKFNTDEGWVGDDFDDLQNTSTQANVEAGEINSTQLENERIANMFESWVSGRTPDINATDARQQRAAWAMWTVMTGNCPPPNVQIDLTGSVRPCGTGFINWLLEFGDQADESEN